MSQNFIDPYQPPPISNASLPAGSDAETLRNVAFWQRFFSVLGYIISGLVLVAMVGQLAVAAMSQGGAAGAIGAVIGMMFFLAITAVVYVIPAMLLGSAAKATRELGDGKISLGDYATQQRKFWRYLGIMVSIVMCLYLVIIVGFVLIGVTAGIST